ncbi:putative disease resistance RPP13-like protein 1 isoform X2 [Quercus robur]|uniref:putative disease resistance RPP13-like protein 1 isoform X2 n=1 Tax=Quercus robur TaxID=38942 RepID=UPI0021617EBF|nr:putative disease resistance RPP13-like protein 1 isoform X2 [Quercus robur]
MSIVLEAVAGAALSAFFDVLIDKLSSSDLLNIFRQENVDADLKKWKTILLKISEVLDDAEEKQITKASVKTWMGELEDLAYDADDILDEFATEALRRKVNAEKPSTSKVRKFIPACCLGLNPSSIMFDANMRSKIKEINTKLQEIVTRKNDLKLEDSAKGRTRTVTSRVPATSLVESHTYGREEDKKAIVELLTGGSGGAQFSTISILGMGGLGKTTLAKLVYNDSELRGYFDVAAWSCVSQDFDTLRVTKEILQDITSKTCNDNDLNLVQRELKKQLSGKKFLLILDDVWIENYSDWTKLRLPFESGAPGSKILITTRHANVSSTMGDTNPYKLGELSNDACLTMFTQHALGTSDFGEHLNDEERQKILDRCKGLPLAAKALAGLLRTYDRDEWKDVLNGRIWDLLEKKTDVPSTLRLSYLYLPSSLKKCFAYCSLFPKGYNFKEKKLVLLWMAEGLVRETEGEKPMEDLGGEYFRDLLKRSFFQQLSINESRFVMHDLMHDLAQWAAGDLCCRLEDPLGGSKISPKVRHISYIDHSINCIKKFDDLPEDMHLRTFLLLTSRFLGKLTNSDAILPQLRSLRVLSLDRYDICELPSSIGDLKHLRYLNLSYTKITILPESTSSLYNLQTLILKDCSNLTKLPEKIENLVNLRHLDITNANSIIEMPVGMAKLKSLQTLSNFVVGKNKIVDLMNLESLRGTLCISHLENMLNANDARNVNLKGKKNLDTLVMEWNGDLQDAGVAIDILNMLQPHVTLKTLSIIGYVGVEFPTWLGDPSFSNMVDVRIERCGKCMFLPAFGQLPCLKHLVIKGLDGVYSVGPEFYGEHCEQPFRSLVKLCFEDMHKWRDWSPYKVGIEELPCLHELSISKCPKLQGKLPHHLPSLKKLSIKECARLVVSIPNLSVLQELTVEECEEVAHGLMSLVTQEINIKSCENLVNIKLKSTPRTLTIERCSALESLQFLMDEGGASSTSSLLMNEENLSCIGNNNASLLEHLEIYNCPSLKCVSTIVDLAAMLKRLDIDDCPNLTSLSSKDILPTTLEVLSVGNCPELELIVDELHKDTLLEDLRISNCEKLRRLPRGLHELSHLKKIYLQERDSLISNCPSLKCISFPEEGFHTNLRELGVAGANLCKQIFEFGLHKLTSLRSLFIARGIMDSLPEEEDGKTMLMLPTSLTSLTFYKFPNLEFLSWKFFQNLSALEQIDIDTCPKLASLSEKCFPPSLQRFHIYNCPVLKQNCEKDKGIMWSKIANIPSVMI